MKTATKELLVAIKNLPEYERIELTQELMATFDGEAEEDVDKAWRKEVQHRLQDIQQKKVQGIPWSEVKKKARRYLREKRRQA